MNPFDVHTCGLLFCYNEENILKYTLEHYLGQGIDLVIFDNYSTDSSMDIIKEFQMKKEQYRGRIQAVIDVETKGYEWQKILRVACDYMHKKLFHYDWIFLIDSDAFYYSPVKGMSLLEFMKMVRRHGYNIINGKLYEFYPTEKDNYAIESPIERIRYYTDRWKDASFSNEQKIFLYHPTIDFYSSKLGHKCKRKNGRVFKKIEFIYKHYPWNSYEHGLKKIFKERIPRYAERAKYPRTNMHYHNLEILPLKKDFVKEPQTLKLYKERQALISRAKFFWAMKLEYLWNVLLRIKKYSSQLFSRAIKKLAHLIMPRAIYKKLRDHIIPPKHKSKSAKAAVEKRTPYAHAFPEIYHFFMTDYCNANCIFCNQKFCFPPKEITIDKFVTMLSNIPTEVAKTFYFSGGGEPLLCQDLFSIIEYVNNALPHIKIYIRTNGLLIGKYAKDLAKLNISRLEISVHGLVGANDFILQRKGSQDIFSGVALLNNHLEQYNKKLYKMFYPTVSQLNIRDLASLIQKAAELKVDAVCVEFCRYYPHKNQKIDEKLKSEDSLFFHKELYNDVIQKAGKLAKSLGVHLRHEPLFFQNVQEKECTQPWRVVLVDCNGSVYPCTGGETWFKEKVQSGKCYFGNLLKEDLGHCWNNPTYIMLRRTCIGAFEENFIPECNNCHNTLCFKSPDLKNGHILETSSGI